MKKKLHISLKTRYVSFGGTLSLKTRYVSLGGINFVKLFVIQSPTILADERARAATLLWLHGSKVDNQCDNHVDKICHFYYYVQVSFNSSLSI